jgi:hypothetical protein
MINWMWLVTYELRWFAVLDMIVYSWNPNIWEAKAGWLQIWIQSRVHSEFKVDYKVTPCLQKKKRKI